MTEKEVKTNFIFIESILSLMTILVWLKRSVLFHLVANQLKTRHSNRESLVISDEYDVQDLLHALLHIYFDDIRPEEWTPNYAGGSSRVDFY